MMVPWSIMVLHLPNLGRDMVENIVKIIPPHSRANVIIERTGWLLDGNDGAQAVAVIPCGDLGEKSITKNYHLFPLPLQ